jgi:hypothetical protein
MKQCLRKKTKAVGNCSKGVACVLLGECIYDHDLIRDNEQAKFILRSTNSFRQAYLLIHKLATGKKFTGTAKRMVKKYNKISEYRLKKYLNPKPSAGSNTKQIEP